LSRDQLNAEQTKNRQDCKPRERRIAEIGAWFAFADVVRAVTGDVQHAADDPCESDPERKLSAVEERRHPQKRNVEDEVLNRVRVSSEGSLEFGMAHGGGGVDAVLAAHLRYAARCQKCKQNGQQRIDRDEMIAVGHAIPPVFLAPAAAFITDFLKAVLSGLMMGPRDRRTVRYSW
jgi:hypothetical protein